MATNQTPDLVFIDAPDLPAQPAPVSVTTDGFTFTFPEED